MAVASGRASRVLARPLFRWPNVRVAHFEYTRSRTCKNWWAEPSRKPVAHVATSWKFHRQKGRLRRCVRIFSDFCLLYGHSLLRRNPCAQPRTPGAIQLSVVCSTYCQWRKGKAGREPRNKNTHSVLDVNQNPAFLWLQLRNDVRANFCCGGMPSICSYYVH